MIDEKLVRVSVFLALGITKHAVVLCFFAVLSVGPCLEASFPWAWVMPSHFDVSVCLLVLWEL